MKILYKYFQAFGLFAGLRNYLACRSSNVVVTLRVPGLSRNIFLRPRSSDVKVFEHVFLDRNYLRDSLTGLDPDVIVDVGANIGMVTLLFASIYPRARIVALEPDPSNYSILERNVRGYAQVKPVLAGIWDTDMMLEIRDPGRGFWSFSTQTPSEDQAGTVRGISMNSLLAEHSIKHVDILKIDIEGGERQIFASSADAWLHRTSCIIIELHDRFVPGCSREFYSSLQGFPYLQDIDGENVIIRLDGQLPTAALRSPTAQAQSR
jgi:FkbM family methyltransferase